jgi:hypothetical protein
LTPSGFQLFPHSDALCAALLHAALVSPLPFPMPSRLLNKSALFCAAAAAWTVDAARVISCGDCARAECDLDKFAANERFSRRKSQI